MQKIRLIIIRILLFPGYTWILFLNYLNMFICHTIAHTLRGGELTTFSKDDLEKKETKG
jgi:hypothetical protein